MDIDQQINEKVKEMTALGNHLNALLQQKVEAVTSQFQGQYVILQGATGWNRGIVKSIAPIHLAHFSLSGNCSNLSIPSIRVNVQNGFGPKLACKTVDISQCRLMTADEIAKYITYLNVDYRINQRAEKNAANNQR